MEIHRCRFVDWIPQSINTLSCCPDGKRIAVARKNGDIEIWNAEFKWFCQYTITGHSKLSIRNMIWIESEGSSQTDDDEDIKEYRLICSGLDGKIYEVDFQKLAFKNESDSYGGAVWSMALKPNDSILALACEDGSIRLFDVSNNSISYIRGIKGSETRLLSICWCETRDDTPCTFVYTGSSDGLIRKWNITNGRIVNKVRVERQGKQNTCIWCISSLYDDICAFGDSLGHLQLWDMKQCVLLESFTKHDADITCMVVNETKTKMLTGGIDGQIVLYELVNVSNKVSKSEKTKWVYSYTHRAHTHDISSVQLFKRKNGMYAVSGGVDCSLIQYNLNNFRNDRPVKVISTIKPNSMKIAHHFMFIQYTHDIHIYRLGSGEEKNSIRTIENGLANGLTPSIEVQQYQITQDYQYLLSYHLEDIGNINSSTYYYDEAKNGIYIAINTDINIKLYFFDLTKNTLVNIPTPEGMNEYRYIYISYLHTKKYLVAITDTGYVHIFNEQNEKMIDILLPKDLITINELPFAGPYIHVSISNDDHTLCFVDVYNRIICIQINYEQKSYKCYFLYNSVLPIVSLSFFPDQKTLLITFSNNTMTIYDTILISPSKEYEYIYNKKLLPNLSTFALLCGAITDFIEQKVLLLWGPNFIYKCDIRPEACELSANNKRVANADRMTTTQSNPSSTANRSALLKEYKPILFMDYDMENSVCIIEREWLDIIQHLPPVFYKKRYGV